MTSRHLAGALVLLSALAFPARADVNLCLNCCGNSSLIYQCYETELTCAEISLGPIIRECEQLSIAPPPGGGGGGGVVGNLHPEVNGQSLVGSSVYGGTATGPSGALSNFVVLWETRDTFVAGRRAQAVAQDASGALFWTEFDVSGTERRGAGDLMITGTPAGQEIWTAFGEEEVGRTAAGDMTITVYVLPVNDPPGALAREALETYHTDVVFDDLEWTFLSSEPVSGRPGSWGTLKAGYN